MNFTFLTEEELKSVKDNLKFYNTNKKFKIQTLLQNILNATDNYFEKNRNILDSIEYLRNTNEYKKKFFSFYEKTCMLLGNKLIDDKIDYTKPNNHLLLQNKKILINMEESKKIKKIGDKSNTQCKKCGSYNTYVNFYQDRAIDEGSSVYVFCVDCGSKMKKR